MFQSWSRCFVKNPTLGREFKFPSYVQDIMGPMCLIMVWTFPLGLFASGKPEDLQKPMKSLVKFRRIDENSPVEIQQQMQDNITWIKGRKKIIW